MDSRVSLGGGGIIVASSLLHVAEYMYLIFNGGSALFSTLLNYFPHILTLIQCMMTSLPCGFTVTSKDFKI